MHIDNSAVEMHVKFQNDTSIINPISRLRDFTRFGSQMSYRFVKKSPGYLLYSS